MYKDRECPRGGKLMYLDILFLENLLINYVILSLTQRFSRKYSTPFKLLLGAFIGAGYVLIFFLTPYSFFREFLAKFLLSLLIIYMAFSPETLKEFFRILSVFYLVSFAMGGTIFALLYAVKGRETALPVGIGFAALLLFLNWDYVVKKAKQDKMKYEIYIEIFGKKVKTYGFVDTGNKLFDPLSNLPVVVVAYSSVKSLLPYDLEEFVAEGKIDFGKVLEIIKDEKWHSRIGIIPFSGVGTKGLLLGIRPDRLIINGKEIKDVMLGISTDKMEFALLNPEIMG
ncbi:sporulation protein [Caldanaerobacter subterraneus subsp. yonseiensis KB-1]|uniref:Sporulation sigma-E factor-processing peptidase n=3 Tax=Caldanaerobacter subterraneus TaxID=911092 RepID=Q8R5R7_CALS4|nr:sporulation specific protein; SpoIIGA [Caldanaerobacter subterraneus subsp. tengcongensis MB4]ERM92814.1 sporulation protein [Caldanaerobacter subterraneus subsp. yonseiensis KB-1]